MKFRKFVAPGEEQEPDPAIAYATASRKRVRERDASAVRLRMQGFTYAQIAAELKFGSSTHCQSRVAAALNEVVREPARELLELELRRLDEMFLPVYARAIEGGGPKAIQSCLHIMERRAKLLGLDKPTKIATTTPDGEALPPPVLDLTTLTEEELTTLEQLLNKSSRAAAPPPAKPSTE